MADEAELLADGETDPDEGEEEPEQEATPTARKPKKKRKGFSADLPRTQSFVYLSDEESEGAIETFFVKVKEELYIISARNRKFIALL